MKYYLLLLVLLISIFPQLVFGQIIINEFQIEPEQQIELWNDSDSPVDLTGWYLDDSGGTTFYTVPENSIIQPQACLVFSSNFYLNKTSSDTVRLFNKTKPPTETDAVLIDSYTYSKSPGENISWQRLPNGSIDWQTAPNSLGLNNTSLENCLISPTPTIAATPIPTSVLVPTPIPTQPDPTTYTTPGVVYLSEIMPNPDSESEWVELYNNNDFSVTLTNWYLDDKADEGSTAKKFSLTLEAKSYAVYELSSAIFNNSGDGVRLLNSDQTEVDSIEYSKADKGISLSRQNFTNEPEWCWTNPSKEKSNQACLTSAETVPNPIITNPVLNNSDQIINTNNLSNNDYSFFQPSALKIELSLYPLRITKEKVLGASIKKDNSKVLQLLSYLNWLERLLVFNLCFSLLTIIYAIYFLLNSVYNINLYEKSQN